MYTTPLIKQRSGRYGNNHWIVYSPKIKREVNLFSDLEFDHWVTIETDWTVETFCEQPDKAEGEEGTSIFDMWIKKKDGREIYFEIKYEKALTDEHVVKQIDIQKKWCEHHGKEHQVRTEKDIRSNEIYLENLKDILPYLLNNSTIVEIDSYKVAAQIKDGRKTLKELNQILNMNLPRLYEAVACLICSGEIRANLEKVYFGLETEVWIDETEKLG
ncbi:hypothetical protein FHS18_004189 [Paenibacillus phyllosphaerae]|uniref:TnsA endonuclease N-terminal domain-containing protein n=1 Tax=Paenibacillus phyllosphaerae TaxID=274593 RepID=A0A7W5B1E6_9BACL|nr:hypothetical protein [Paenibacillus phyllosphaerae]